MGFFKKLFGIEEELIEDFEEDYDENNGKNYTSDSAREKNLDILSDRFEKHAEVDVEKADFSFHIVQATSCDVFYEVAHILKNQDCVALSIKGMEPHEAQRLTDCICGVILALDGHIEIEATKPDVLILTPNSIEISTGDYASIFTRLASF